jgi:hypothetical protein
MIEIDWTSLILTFIMITCFALGISNFVNSNYLEGILYCIFTTISLALNNLDFDDDDFI